MRFPHKQTHILTGAGGVPAYIPPRTRTSPKEHKQNRLCRAYTLYKLNPPSKSRGPALPHLFRKDKVYQCPPQATRAAPPLSLQQFRFAETVFDLRVVLVQKLIGIPQTAMFFFYKRWNPSTTYQVGTTYSSSSSIIVLNILRGAYSTCPKKKGVPGIASALAPPAVTYKSDAHKRNESTINRSQHRGLPVRALPVGHCKGSGVTRKQAIGINCCHKPIHGR